VSGWGNEQVLMLGSESLHPYHTFVCWAMILTLFSQDTFVVQYCTTSNEKVDGSPEEEDTSTLSQELFPQPAVPCT
jgi:hypothetical protein